MVILFVGAADLIMRRDNDIFDGNENDDTISLLVPDIELILGNDVLDTFAENMDHFFPFGEQEVCTVDELPEAIEHEEEVESVSPVIHFHSVPDIGDINDRAGTKRKRFESSDFDDVESSEAESPKTSLVKNDLKFSIQSKRRRLGQEPIRVDFNEQKPELVSTLMNASDFAILAHVCRINWLDNIVVMSMHGNYTVLRLSRPESQ